MRESHRSHFHQQTDLKEKGLSKGEFNLVMQAVGGVDAMIDPDCKDKDLLALRNALNSLFVRSRIWVCCDPESGLKCEAEV